MACVRLMPDELGGTEAMLSRLLQPSTIRYIGLGLIWCVQLLAFSRNVFIIPGVDRMLVDPFGIALLVTQVATFAFISFFSLDSFNKHSGAYTIFAHVVACAGIILATGSLFFEQLTFILLTMSGVVLGLGISLAYTVGIIQLAALDEKERHTKVAFAFVVGAAICLLITQFPPMWQPPAMLILVVLSAIIMSNNSRRATTVLSNPANANSMIRVDESIFDGIDFAMTAPDLSTPIYIGWKRGAFAASVVAFVFGINTKLPSETTVHVIMIPIAVMILLTTVVYFCLSLFIKKPIRPEVIYLSLFPIAAAELLVVILIDSSFLSLFAYSMTIIYQMIYIALTVRLIEGSFAGNTKITRATGVSFCFLNASLFAGMLFASYFCQAADNRQMLIATFAPLFVYLLFFSGYALLWERIQKMMRYDSERKESKRAVKGKPDVKRISDKINENLEALAESKSLTVREVEIIKYLMHGRSVNSIAGQLILSPHTVKTHVRNVYNKVGVTSRQELLDILEQEDL